MSSHSTDRAAGVVQAFRELLKSDSVTCAISDCMGRFGAMRGDLRPLFESIRFAGTAVTARTLPGDPAAVFKAIDVSRPGDAVVVPPGAADEVLDRTRRLLDTVHVLQDRLRSGATIGELIGVDRVFESTFDYQQRALDGPTGRTMNTGSSGR
ncbi:MAG TPA: hypothetical protein VFX81_10970 [Burkholderiaceae bacterium]|nr:hypothetical protein [Burkholderiaceae bacterium]